MKVFISHSFSDENLAKILQTLLQKENIYAYMAQQKPEYNISVGDKIRKEIRDSDFVVGILSESGLCSPSVNQELGYSQGIGFRPIAMVEKGITKHGALTSEFEREEFTREEFEYHCERVIKFVLEQPTQKSSIKKLNTIDPEYRTLYNKITELQNDENYIKNKFSDPWQEIDNFSKRTLSNNTVELLQKLSAEIKTWKMLSNQLEREFSYKHKEIGDLFKECFKKNNLLNDNEMIMLTEYSSQEPRHWVEAFKEVILFDKEIDNPNTLYNKLYAHAMLRPDEHISFLKRFRQRAPFLFDCIFEKIPEARKIFLDLIDGDLLDQKNRVKSLASTIQENLESEILGS